MAINFSELPIQPYKAGDTITLGRCCVSGYVSGAELPQPNQPTNNIALSVDIVSGTITLS